jgi:uncharacterized protein YegL
MTIKDMNLNRDELFVNPTTRVPVCLVLDTSGSMGQPHAGEAKLPIDALNEGVAHFFRAVEQDEMACSAADVAIVSFSDRAEVVQDFGPVTRTPPQLTVAGGLTSLGSGVLLGLDLLTKRKARFKNSGIDYFQPWLVVMTDGFPTDDTHNEVTRDVAEQVERGKLSVFPIGIGSEANLSVLAHFTPRRTPLRLKGLEFGKFFDWLSASVAATSRSISPGERVPLDVEGIKGWAEL